MGQTIDYDKLAAQHGGTVVDYDAIAQSASAHIGPVTVDDTAPVTLGDLIDNPHLALQRMVAITKKAMSDPREMLPVVAGLGLGIASKLGLGTGTIPGREAPTMEPSGEAPGLMQRIRQNVNPDDLAGTMPSQARAGYRVAKQVYQAVKGSPAEAAPAPQPAAPTPGSFADFVLKKYGPKATAEQIIEARRSYTEAGRPAARTRPIAAPVQSPPAVAPTQSPTPDVPVASAPTPPPRGSAPTRTTASKPSPKAASPSPAADVGDLPSLDELHLTPAEITQAVKWHESGVSPETILHRILQSRQLTARIGASTPDEAARAIAERNRTGKWPD